MRIRNILIADSRSCLLYAYSKHCIPQQHHWIIVMDESLSKSNQATAHYPSVPLGGPGSVSSGRTAGQANSCRCLLSRFAEILNLIQSCDPLPTETADTQLRPHTGHAKWSLMAEFLITYMLYEMFHNIIGFFP